MYAFLLIVAASIDVVIIIDIIEFFFLNSIDFKTHFWNENSFIFNFILFYLFSEH